MRRSEETQIAVAETTLQWIHVKERISSIKEYGEVDALGFGQVKNVSGITSTYCRKQIQTQ